MDQRQLRHFVTVARTLHFGRAAAHLRMTQPPLSQSIRALENELGAPLFVRTRRSVALTPFGEQWLAPVRAALEATEALRGLAQRILSGDAGQLAVSFVSTADYSILPQLVQRFRERYPGVELHLTEATSDVQTAALQAGKGNVGIIIRQGQAPVPEGLSYRQLVSEALIAAVPDAWLESGRITGRNACMSAGELAASPLIVFPRRVAPSFYDLVMDYHTSCGGAPHIVQHAIQMQTIISLVSAGMGVALVPESMRCLARAGVTYLDLERPALPLETGLIWRQNDTSATLANFLALATPSATV